MFQAKLVEKNINQEFYARYTFFPESLMGFRDKQKGDNASELALWHNPMADERPLFNPISSALNLSRFLITQ
jgi:hypothetical protein